MSYYPYSQMTRFFTQKTQTFHQILLELIIKFKIEEAYKFNTKKSIAFLYPIINAPRKKLRKQYINLRKIKFLGIT